MSSQNPRGYFSYAMGVGGSYRDEAAVVNYGTTALRLSVYAADLANDDTGTIVVGLAKDATKDAGGWVKLPSKRMTVVVPAASSDKGPGRVVVPFLITVPNNASPGDHGGAIVAVLSTLGKNPRGENVQLDQRIAARLYIRVNGPLHPMISIDHLTASYHSTLNPFGSGHATVSYVVHNTGNVRLSASQLVAVTGMFGTKSSKIVPPQVPLLFPGSSQAVTVDVAGVLPTVLQKAHVTVTPLLFQDQKPMPVPEATRTATFVAVPWGLLGLLVALVVLLLVVLFIRRRRRRRPPTGKHTPSRPDTDSARTKPDHTDESTPQQVSVVQTSSRSGGRRAVVVGVIVGLFTLGAFVNSGWATADAVPFDDTNATGLIGFCDPSGHTVTKGKLRDAPFVWTAVSSQAAPDGYASPGGRATLFAFQPIQYVDPGDWSGKQLTAASQFTNSAHPMAQATKLDPPLLSFTGAFPPRWDGLVQLRMYFSAGDKPQFTSTYPAAVLRISGDSWTMVQGATPDCSAGKATSIEAVALPSSAFARPSTASGASTRSVTGSGKSRSASGTSAPSSGSGSADSSASPVAATASNKSSGSSNATVFWLVLGAVVVVAAGGVVVRRRRHRVPGT